MAQFSASHATEPTMPLGRSPRDAPTSKHSCIRVLLIEDNPGDAELICIALADADASSRIHHVSRLQDGLDALPRDEWNVILSDLSLPDSQGLESVRRLRLWAPQLPIVVLTSHASDDTALMALDEGAQDYLVKDCVTPEILQRAIRYAVQRQANSEMRRLIATLRNQERLLKKKNHRLKQLYRTAHRFVDNVSHEFRTPLTVIKEYVSLVQEGALGELNDDQWHMLDVVSDRTDDLNNMVNDMLDVSKLDAGMLAVWRKPCDVAEIIDHIRPSLDRKSHVKHVALDFDVPANLPRVFCDDEKIGRVIINLVINAIKFSGDPGHVVLCARPRFQTGEVVIAVTDNGIGIDPAHLQAIFRRFKQVGSNPRGSTQGFGLGLNIVRELVDLNLGHVRVGSEPGQGSTFEFTIPFAEPSSLLASYLRKLVHPGDSQTSLLLVSVTVEEPTHSKQTDEAGAFLARLSRRHDLLVPLDERRFLWVLRMKEPELPAFLAEVQATRRKTNKDRPHEFVPDLTLEFEGRWEVAEQPDALLTAVQKIQQRVEVNDAQGQDSSNRR